MTTIDLTTTATEQTFTLTDEMQSNVIQLALLTEMLSDENLGDELRAEYVEHLGATVKALPAGLVNALQVDFAVRDGVDGLTAEYAAKFSN